MADVTYDRWYRESDQACGEPFPLFEQFCAAQVGPGTTVLDLGCGQGRDALLFARHGASVVGVDISAVGVEQLNARAAVEGLPIQAFVGDVLADVPTGVFDVVLLDRVLHMAPQAEDRARMLATAMAAVKPGGALLVADEPSNGAAIRGQLRDAGWSLFVDTKNRWFARNGQASPGGG